MPTYAIGDVQGCLLPLQQLLKSLPYHPETDTLWFSGDLINRGPHSLETLRFIRSLPRTQIVLGNHDIGLLAIDSGLLTPAPTDTYQAILAAPDKEELFTWLRSHPLLHHDPHLGFTLTHAGIFPQWDLSQAQALAQEVSVLLQSPDYRHHLAHLFHDKPTHWETRLEGWPRWRFILQAFTRMRFCTPEGDLIFKAKGHPSEYPHYLPWFAFPDRRTQHNKLLFGHWAALRGHCSVANVYPLDTGCVWGECLTAFCLETGHRKSVPCAHPSK